MNPTPLIFHTRNYAYLAADLVPLMQAAGGEVEVKTFPDGERYQRILSQVRGREVVLVGGLTGDADTLEWYDLACALVKHGAHSLTMVVPYFAYSTMERAVLPGEVVTAKTRARLISAVPAAPAGNRIVLLDLHTEGLPHYFEGPITPYHLYGKPLVMETCRRLAGNDFVIACTDAGRAKWVESLANDMGVDAAFVFKKRLSGSETRITGVSANVEGRKVILYDDMIRTGGSLIHAARAYAEAGALTVSAIATHGVLPGESARRIQDSGLFQTLVVTDSHPRARELASDFVQVVNCAPLFAKFLSEYAW